MEEFEVSYWFLEMLSISSASHLPCSAVVAPCAAAILSANYLFIPRALMDAKEQLTYASPIVNACLRNYP